MYSCEYQFLVSEYLAEQTVSVEIPYYPAPDNAPGDCPCNLGEVFDNITANVGAAGSTCSKYVDGLSDAVFTCECCGWSAALSAYVCHYLQFRLHPYIFTNRLLTLYIDSTESVPTHLLTNSEFLLLTAKPPILRKPAALAQDLLRIPVPSTVSTLPITEHPLILPLCLLQAQMRYRQPRVLRRLPRHRRVRPLPGHWQVRHLPLLLRRIMQRMLVRVAPPLELQVMESLAQQARVLQVRLQLQEVC